MLGVVIDARKKLRAFFNIMKEKLYNAADIHTSKKMLSSACVIACVRNTVELCDLLCDKCVMLIHKNIY